MNKPGKSATVCRECKFYRPCKNENPLIPDNQQPAALGHCIARPPMASSNEVFDAEYVVGSSVIGSMPIFPFVDPSDWCGAFRRAD